MLKLVSPIFPTLIRLCALSTFIEDGFRSFYFWDEQTENLAYGIWFLDMFLATLVIHVNIFGQFVGSIMILLRWNVDIACVLLFGIFVMQVLQLSCF